MCKGNHNYFITVQVMLRDITNKYVYYNAGPRVKVVSMSEMSLEMDVDPPGYFDYLARETNYHFDFYTIIQTELAPRTTVLQQRRPHPRPTR